MMTRDLEAKCRQYAQEAVEQSKVWFELDCPRILGFSSQGFDEDPDHHYNYCLSTDGHYLEDNHRQRKQMLDDCRAACGAHIVAGPDRIKRWVETWVMEQKDASGKITRQEVEVACEWNVARGTKTFNSRDPDYPFKGSMERGVMQCSTGSHKGNMSYDVAQGRMAGTMKPTGGQGSNYGISIVPQRELDRSS